MIPSGEEVRAVQFSIVNDGYAVGSVYKLLRLISWDIESGRSPSTTISDTVLRRSRFQGCDPIEVDSFLQGILALDPWASSEANAELGAGESTIHRYSAVGGMLLALGPVARRGVLISNKRLVLPLDRHRDRTLPLGSISGIGLTQTSGDLALTVWSTDGLVYRTPAVRELAGVGSRRHGRRIRRVTRDIWIDVATFQGPIGPCRLKRPKGAPRELYRQEP